MSDVSECNAYRQVVMPDVRIHRAPVQRQIVMPDVLIHNASIPEQMVMSAVTGHNARWHVVGRDARRLHLQRLDAVAGCDAFPHQLWRKLCPTKWDKQR